MYTFFNGFLTESSIFFWEAIWHYKTFPLIILHTILVTIAGEKINMFLKPYPPSALGKNVVFHSTNCMPFFFLWTNQRNIKQNLITISKAPFTIKERYIKYIGISSKTTLTRINLPPWKVIDETKNLSFCLFLKPTKVMELHIQLMVSILIRIKG